MPDAGIAGTFPPATESRNDERVGAPGQQYRAPSGGAPCENCGGGPVGRFCAQCGQQRFTEHDLTTRGFLRDSFHELTSFDGRLWRTLVVLVRHPGKLTRDYFDGRGGRYMKPLNLFVLLNLVFFIIQPHTGLLRYDLASYIDYDGDVAAHRRDLVNESRADRALAMESARRAAGQPARAPRLESVEVFRTRFDDELQDQKKSFFIVSIPLLAIAMLVLYAPRHLRFAEHLVFSVHVYGFFLLFAGVAVTPAFWLVAYPLKRMHAAPSVLNALASERALILVFFVVMGSYLFHALRRMYGDTRPTAALRAVVLFIVMQVLIVGYHDVLFRTTLLSL